MPQNPTPNHQEEEETPLFIIFKHTAAGNPDSWHSKKATKQVQNHEIAIKMVLWTTDLVEEKFLTWQIRSWRTKSMHITAIQQAISAIIFTNKGFRSQICNKKVNPKFKNSSKLLQSSQSTTFRVRNTEREREGPGLWTELPKMRMRGRNWTSKT